MTKAEINQNIEKMIRTGDITGLADFLKSSEGNIRAVTVLGESLLHKAALYGQVDMIRLLIGRGLPVDLTDPNGFTPLHEAARGGMPDAVEFLLARNARNDLLTLHSRKTALDLARDKKDERCIYLLTHHMTKEQKMAVATELEERRRLSEHELERIAQEKEPRWGHCNEDSITRTQIRRDLACKLTEIFNFSSRTYILRTENLDTRVEAVFMKTFGEFADEDLLIEARTAFRQAGGTLPVDLFEEKKGRRISSASFIKD